MIAFLHHLSARILAFFKSRGLDDDFTQELESHVDMLTEDNIRRGMAPEEARRSALIRVGAGASIKEQHRAARGLPALETAIQDLRFAFRLLIKERWFSAAAIIVLALAIGANTAIFSLTDAALLRSLPVADPEQLVSVRTFDPRGQANGLSYPMFAYLRERADVAGLIASAAVSLNLRAGAVTDSAEGMLVSDNYFQVLGVQPVIGRGFTSNDEPAIVLSHAFWQTRFNRDPEIAGRGIILNGLPFTIVGVAPKPFFGVEVGKSPDVFVPIGTRDRLMPGTPRLPLPNNFWLVAIARIRPDVTEQGATARMNVLFQQALVEQASIMRPNVRRFLEQRRVAFAPASKGVRGIGTQFREPLLILMTVVSLVLLIACVNVANLLLVRGEARRREIAVRLAIGAGRMRLLRQFLTESLVLSVAGGLLGLTFAVWSSRALARVLTSDGLDVSLDFRVLGFASAVTLITGLIFGTMPALAAMRTRVTAEFRGDRSRGGAVGRSKASALLVSSQVAVAMILLVAAGLFIRTLGNVRAIDRGFAGDDVLLATVDAGLNRYTPERIQTLSAEFLDRVSALPGVRSASIGDAALLSGSSYVSGVSIEGSSESAQNVRFRFVATRFFETMGIAVRLGRDFSPEDREGAPRVAIVNESFARTYLSGQSPIGRRLGGDDGPMEVIGVIADTKYRSLKEAVPITVYFPLAQGQAVVTERTLHVRAAGSPADLAPLIREQVRALDANLPVEIKLFNDLMDTDLIQERLLATLSGFFGTLALILTAVGLYGVISYGARRRTREIGIRMALGAGWSSVSWLVVRDSLMLVGLGVAAGLPVCWWLSRFVEKLLFGIDPGDPATLIGAVIVLVLVATFAAYVPARRGARINPISALRYE